MITRFVPKGTFLVSCISPLSPTVYFQQTNALLVMSGFCVYSVASALFMFPALYLHTHTHVCTHTRIDTCTCTFILTCTHIHVRVQHTPLTHTHAHTHTQVYGYERADGVGRGSDFLPGPSPPPVYIARLYLFAGSIQNVYGIYRLSKTLIDCVRIQNLLAHSE